MSSSVGIIGGADGPTSIFVTASPMADFWCYMLAVVVAAGVVAFLIHKRNRSK